MCGKHTGEVLIVVLGEVTSCHLWKQKVQSQRSEIHITTSSSWHAEIHINVWIKHQSSRKVPIVVAHVSSHCLDTWAAPICIDVQENVPFTVNHKLLAQAAGPCQTFSVEPWNHTYPYVQMWVSNQANCWWLILFWSQREGARSASVNHQLMISRSSIVLKDHHGRISSFPTVQSKEPRIYHHRWASKTNIGHQCKNLYVCYI